MKDKLRVMLIDNHPVVIEGMRSIISNHLGYNIISTCMDGKIAWNCIQTHHPDMIILDYELPGMSGIEIIKQLKHSTATKVILFTSVTDEEKFSQVVECGVDGFIFKDSTISEILRCVKDVTENRYYMPHNLTNYVQVRNKNITNHLYFLKKFTHKEMNIIKLISLYYSNKEIAREMSASERTIENHRYNIMKKLNISGKNALLRFAVENKNYFVIE